MNILGIIPARGGSKGIARKNIAQLGDKPLIAWIIKAAQQSRHITRLICSTDDAEIASVAEAHGCEVPFTRPAELATDNASSIDVVLHALDTLKQQYDLVLLLQATSPFCSTTDIDACLEMALKDPESPVIGVSTVEVHPAYTVFLGKDNKLDAVLPKIIFNHPRRQDLQPAFKINGAVWAASTKYLRTHRSFVTPDTRGCVMPPERSIDIDTPSDLQQARAHTLQTSETTR